MVMMMEEVVEGAKKALRLRFHGEMDVCEVSNVTYDHRVDNPDMYNFCPVPGGGEDSFLFAAIAVIAVCLLHFSSLSAVLVLVCGAAMEIVVFCYNCGRLGNAFTLWLGVNPPELLLYGFLPPLLLDAALGLDWFIFKKVSKHAVVYAFLVVIATTVMMTPLLLYGLNLMEHGWKWQHGALFVSTLASTDALAVSAIIKGTNGPEHLTALMEGESLLNDATSLVLFTVFMASVQKMDVGGPQLTQRLQSEKVFDILPNMAYEIARLAAGGALVGLLFGWLTLKCLRLLRRTGASGPRELAFIQGMSFFTFYIANAPLNVSGVIAVVIFGMYGAATSKFELANSQKALQLDALQNTLAGALNGVVFFLGGATAVNFLIRATPALNDSLALTMLYIPAIYGAMFVVRGISVALFNALFYITRNGPLEWKSLPFVTWGGLRGSLSLIMAMVIAAEQAHDVGLNTESRITAQIVTWTSSFVLLTLIVNAPTLPAVLKKFGLLDIPMPKKRMMKKARKALKKKTKEIVSDLKADEDELLRGVDWKVVNDITLGNISEQHEIGLTIDSRRRHFTKGSISHIMAKKTHPYSDQERAHDDIERPLLGEQQEGSQEQARAAFNEQVSEAKQDAEKETPFLARRIEPTLGFISTGPTSISSRQNESYASPDGASSPLDPIRPLDSDLHMWWSTGIEEKGQEEPAASSRIETRSAVENLVEARIRLVWGLKRYIFSKRAEGLLSPDGARVLAHACDVAIENSEKPLDIWTQVNKDVADRFQIQFAAWIFHSARRAAYSSPVFARSAVVSFVKFTTAWLGDFLSKAMLQSCEVAIAYFMALSYSPQAQWLDSSDTGSSLLNELQMERERVCSFVVDREIEAPAHFEAMQTYRAIMAVLTRQLVFIDSMLHAGVIDDPEKEEMATPIMRCKQTLEVIGPTGYGWQRADDVLHSLSFLACLPQELVRDILLQGSMKEFGGNEVVWSDSTALDEHAFAIVVRGLVKSTSVYSDGSMSEKYMGSGSILGLLPALSAARAHLPGWEQIIAQSSRLQKGVLVFFMPAKALANAKACASEGIGHYQTMMLELHRQAGIQILDALKTPTLRSISAAWERVALEKEVALLQEEGEESKEEVQDEDSMIDRDTIRVKAQKFASKIEASIRRLLGEATVLNLEPYQSYRQRSHVILLSGAVQSHKAGGKALKRAVSMGQRILAPQVLPLLPASLRPQNEDEDPYPIFLSGHEGATLIVCPITRKANDMELTDDAAQDSSMSIFGLSGQSANTGDLDE